MKYVLITLGLALLTVGTMTVFSSVAAGVPSALLTIAGAMLIVVATSSFS